MTMITLIWPWFTVRSSCTCVSKMASWWDCESSVYRPELCMTSCSVQTYKMRSNLYWSEVLLCSLAWSDTNVMYLQVNNPLSPSSSSSSCFFSVLSPANSWLGLVSPSLWRQRHPHSVHGLSLWIRVSGPWWACENKKKHMRIKRSSGITIFLLPFVSQMRIYNCKLKGLVFHKSLLRLIFKGIHALHVISFR